MHLLKLVTCFFLLITSCVYAQPSEPALSKDPVFNAVLLRQIRYPVLAERTGVYTRVYASFRLNEQGHIEAITLISTDQTKYGFGEAVVKGLKHMPALNPRYAGQYIVPIDFAYINYDESPEPLLPPVQDLPIVYYQGCTFLHEIRIVGNSRTYRPNGVLTPTPLNSPGRVYY
ncbi:hypothetical protein ACFSUS_24000 [Spirosoma soli]|uniref:TonB family protein n=1 Tax=Spirosoma soli TaxID=1770529 RepID=A0ABW5MB84_9BACT